MSNGMEPPTSATPPAGPPVARPIEVLDHAIPADQKPGRISALIDVAIFAVLSVAIWFGVSTGAVVLHRLGIITDPAKHPVLLQFVIVVPMCLLVAAILAVRRQPLASIGWNANRWPSDAAIGFIVWVGIMLFSMMLALLFFILWPEAYKSLAQNRENIEALFGAMSVSEILVMCLMVAAYEEFLFRGFVLSRLRQLTHSDTAGVLLTSLVFGSLHTYQGPAAVGLVFILGIIFGALVLWRKSLLPAVVAHFLFNTGMLLIIHFDLAADPEVIRSIQ